MSQRHPTQNQHMMLVTTVTKNRQRLFADEACAREAVEAIYHTQELHPFFLYGFVIMPDHCHIMLHVPEKQRVSNVVGVYKRKVTFRIGRGPMRQSRFHLTIPRDCGAALQYIHLNPVRANLCEIPEAYPWSSASGRWDVMQL